MKKIMLHLQAGFMFLMVYFTVFLLTKDQYAAIGTVAGMGAFSAVMYLPNRRTRRFMQRNGLAFTGFIIPDFTGKSVDEIEKFIESTKKEFASKTKPADEVDKMTTEEVIAYKKECNIYEQAILKAEHAADLNKALEKLNEGSVSKEEFESLRKKFELALKELEMIGLGYKSMTEKGSGLGTEKTELEKFIERKKDTDKTNGWEKTTVKAAALMTTANIVPNVTGGFNQLFGNYIDSTIHTAPKNKPFIMQLVDTQTAPGTEKIWYVQRINEEGDAQFIAEGALKPLIDGEYKEFSADVKEVAERWKVSRRLMNHAPTAVSDFKEHARELIELKMDDGVLSGDGTGNNLSGVTTLASPFIVPVGLANYYDAPNIFDVIMAVATYVRLNKFKGQLTCVLNTVWEAKMFGVKEPTNKAYILPSFVAPDGSKVGSVSIQFENEMPEEDILLGDLKQFKVRISEDVYYAEGYENDDFSKNLESRKMEAFLGTYLPSNKAGAIIYDTIATILTSIDLAGA